LIIEILEIFTELAFVVYLCIILYTVVTGKRKIWVIYFIPIVILFVFSFTNDILKIAGLSELPFFSEQNFNTYLLLVVAFYSISLLLNYSIMVKKFT
jgi:hypothetical protein